MDNQFFVCVYSDRVILITTVGCIFECRRKIEIRFNRNVSVDDMKGRISAKFVRCCGRRILKLFYKFSISTNLIKFIDMELVDNDNVETMVALYCQFEIDLNALPTPDNLNPGPHLQIHHVVIETYAYGEDGYDNNGPSNHEVEDYSDPYLDEVPNDIDDEGMNEDGNVYTSSIENLSRDIFIRNDLGAHMSIVNPCVAHASKFLEYSDILPAHRLVADLECEELFVGQKFTTKEDWASNIDAKNGAEISKPYRGGTPCTLTSINVEQYIDEVYTLECTLRIWGNQFPILRDFSTWEVPLLTFEFVPNKGLRKKSKSRL
ncbi:hypothetical protein GOBAR_DD01807 [Gossypium barbadense]|nr:hypothetical protein GOBAR_DD01807 [Gossypium barbadense]